MVATEDSVIGSELEVCDVDDVRVIRLKRPGKMNALTDTDTEGIREAVRTAPGVVSALMICGHDGNFSTGPYVNRFRSRTVAEILEAGYTPDPSVRMLAELRTCELPTVAAIEGYCFGVAMDIAAVCDIRVAARSAQFSMPEIKLGLPVVVDASLFQQYFGLAKAREIILTGRMYTAEHLAPYGFINELTEVGETEASAMAFAKELAGLPARAVAAQKRLFETWLQMPHREASQVSLLEYAVTLAHPETEENIKAYRYGRRGNAVGSGEAFRSKAV